jgi:hypothetical protein
MALKFVPYTPEVATAMHLLLVAPSGVGKTTACASLLREKTLLLYIKKVEPHSVTYICNGVTLFEGASTRNLMAVAVDIAEASDIDFLPFADRVKVGDKLNPDQSLLKLRMYLQAAAESGFKAVVLDSLTGVFSIFRGSEEFKNKCRGDKGEHSGFKESPTYLTMHEELNYLLVDLRDKGVTTVSILGAKVLNAGDEGSAIQPDLPMYSVAEKMPFRYSDNLILSTRSFEGSEDYRTVIDFGLTMDKSGKDTKTGKEKFVSIKPRLSFLPPDLKIAWLPPDLYKLREYVEAIKMAQESE